MSNQNNLRRITDYLSQSLIANSFIKASLGNYQGNDKELKSLHVRKIKIKKADMLSFTYRYKTRDIIKNCTIDEGITKIGSFLSNDFKICTLFTIQEEIILEHNKKGVISIRINAVKSIKSPNLNHDHVKTRPISSSEKPYLVELKVTDNEGNVFKQAQDKYRQINKYIEILSSLINEQPASGVLNVVDMGSGKGYLTFALYDYLQNILKLENKVTGVEYRDDLVQLCNGISKRSGFENLNFVQGTIESYAVPEIDLLIALHACDTATDDAIFKGIQAKASLIVVAPCCHKQLRREMEKGKAQNELSFLTKYGIFLERQAEMVTDGLRALMLEHEGYKTKVFEFISDVHTPKNVMIVGIKGKVNDSRKQEIRSQINELKQYFGIEKHHLGFLLGI